MMLYYHHRSNFYTIRAWINFLAYVMINEGMSQGIGMGDFEKCFLIYIVWFTGLKVITRRSWKRETRIQWSREGAARAGDGSMLCASADGGEGEGT
jgi:hypothetical protein